MFATATVHSLIARKTIAQHSNGEKSKINNDVYLAS